MTAESRSADDTAAKRLRKHRNGTAATPHKTGALDLKRGRGMRAWLMFASCIASLAIVACALGFSSRSHPAFASRGEPLRRGILTLREPSSVSSSAGDDYEVEAKGQTSRGTQTVEVTRIPKAAPNESEGRGAAEEDQPEPIAISGLLSPSAFDGLRRIHCTLTLLRLHLPNLLDLPVLSPKNFALIYSTNVTVKGPSDEILGQGRDEVILLNRALAIAATTARGADRLIELAVGGLTSSASGVECEMLIDPNNPLQVMTLWKATLPTAPFGGDGAKEAVTEISGTTIVTISKEDGLVDNLKLTEVKLNGVRLIDSLGSAVASIRQVTRSVASSFFDETQREKRNTGNPLFDGLLNGIQQTLDTLPQAEDDEKKTASLLVVPRQFWNITKITDLEYTPLPVDEYSVQNKVPLTGSEEFVKYALVQESLMSFATFGVHILAGTAEVEGQLDLIRDMFTPDATYAGETEEGERTQFLQGKRKLSDFYRSLALLRDSSGGDWSVSSMFANTTERTLTISWASQSPISVEGTDTFHFEEPQLSSNPQRLPLVSDGDDFAAVTEFVFDDDRRGAPLKIERVDNKKLIVSGVRAGSDWSKRFISAAMTMSGGPPDTTLVDLLKTLTTRPKRPSRPGSSDKGFTVAMRRLDGDAAISFYALLRSLHADLVKIANTDESPIVPGGEYLSDSVELRGLLGESIAQGRDGYLRLLRLATTSLSTTVATNIVRLAAEPKSRIEITQAGDIRVVFILALWASPQIPSLGGDSGFGVPLKIEITSEYCINDDGRVSEHKILESRLNGVLTPGDVFSQWIKRLSAGEEGQKGAGFSIIDALSWVRTIQQERGGR